MQQDFDGDVLPDVAGEWEEDESGINEFDQDPVLTKFQTEDSQHTWLRELESSRQTRKDFIKAGHKTIDRYCDKRSDSNKQHSYYNLFFANSEIVLAALYAQTPSPDIKRRFNDPNDQVARVAAEILTRNISYELETRGFDSMFKQILFDRRVPGMGVGFVRYDCEQNEVVPYPDTLTDPMSGEEVPHPMAGQSEPGEITDECAEIDYVPWDDFYWAPCRNWHLCRWVARRIPMSKDAIEARFSDTVDAATISNLAFSTKSSDTDSKAQVKFSTEQTVDVYEIWDKEEKLIWWISEGASVPLDVKEDTNQFDGFFPTPMPPLGRYTTTSTLPVSDFSIVQDLYNQLDSVSDRCSKLTDAARLKWVYNNAVPELKDLFQTASELEGVPIKDWAQFNEKGGLAGGIQFLPLDDITKSLATLEAIAEQIKDKINTIEGISDLFRGASTPNETTLATAQKSAFGTSRLSIVQQEVAVYCEALLRLKAHLITKFYTPQTLIERAGTMAQADQMIIPQAIELLKNEGMANFRLDVSVDSIQLPNWNMEKAEKTEVFKAIVAALQQLQPVIMQSPTMGPFSIQLLQWAMTGYKGAQEMEGELQRALMSSQQLIQQKATQPPQPSPAQMEMQMKQQALQVQAQNVQTQNQTKIQIAGMNAQLEQQDMALRQQDQQLEALKIQAGIHDDAHSHAHRSAIDVGQMTQPLGGF